MELKIYLFRHGQTVYNRDKKFTGFTDSKLTLQGIKDAKKVAKLLKNKKINVAYETRLSRSKDTLKEVLKFHPECKKIIEDDRMIERGYGNLQTHSHKGFMKDMSDGVIEMVEKKYGSLYSKTRRKFGDIVAKDIYDLFHRSYDIPPPGGESVEMVEKRVNYFIKDLLKYMKKNKVNVAISAHGNSMRPFRKYFEKISREEMMKIENPWDDYFEYTIKI